LAALAKVIWRGTGGGPVPPAGDLYDCPATVAIGDAVYVSGADTVDKAFAGVPGQTEDAIGVVASKPTGTTCRVVSSGAVGGYAGLATGQRYFLSDTAAGGITNAAPAGAGEKVQQIGIASSATKLHVRMDWGVIL
jgi:hypothetical protein